jgi:hypothetical protein
VFFYYFIVVAMSAAFYLLFLLNKELFLHSKPLIISLVLWVMFVCFLFPVIVSFVSPLPALIITLFFAVFGGYTLYSRVVNNMLQKQTPLFLLPSGKIDTEYLLPQVAQECERKEELLLPEETVGPESIDELISGAFQAKEKNDLELAIDYFKRALNLTEDSSLRGLINTELIYLYREAGQYLEAAKLAKTFANENVSIFSPSLNAQFLQLEAYMKKIDELLLSAGLPKLPFSQVPSLIKLRAEEVLKE